MSERKSVNIRTTAKVNEMIDELMKSRGYINIGDLVRDAIRHLHEDTVVPKRGRPPKGKEDKEQKCRDLGGEVVEEEGVKYCLQKFGEGSQKTPLELL